MEQEAASRQASLNAASGFAPEPSGMAGNSAFPENERVPMVGDYQGGGRRAFAVSVGGAHDNVFAETTGDLFKAEVICRRASALRDRETRLGEIRLSHQRLHQFFGELAVLRQAEEPGAFGLDAGEPELAFDRGCLGLAGGAKSPAGQPFCTLPPAAGAEL